MFALFVLALRLLASARVVRTRIFPTLDDLKDGYWSADILRLGRIRQSAPPEPAIETERSDARKECTDRVKGASEQRAQRRFERQHFENRWTCNADSFLKTWPDVNLDWFLERQLSARPQGLATSAEVPAIRPKAACGYDCWGTRQPLPIWAVGDLRIGFFL
jgi:hypothetical protein